MGKRPDFGYYNDDNVFVKVMWLPRAPASSPYAMKCQWLGELVKRNDPRWRVDNSEGKETALSHGKRNQYICDDCARRLPNYPTAEQTSMW